MMAEPLARKCSVPRDALAYRAFDRVDYADAYSIEIGGHGHEVLERYARVMFENPPRWVSGLMDLRDRVVSVIGLKTSAELKASGDSAYKHSGDADGTAGRIGPFPVLTRSENELLLGADDSHLDFRISIQCARIHGGSQLRVITVVKFNNLLGRLYFLPVRPIHCIIVPTMMDQAARLVVAIM